MRKWLVAFLGFALVLLGALLTLVMPRHCPVSRAAFERIKEGMTRAEVYAILGGAPGDYRTHPPAPRGCRYHVYQSPPLLIEAWEGDEGVVTVQYDAVHPGHETVSMTTFDGAAPFDPDLVELARWRLERLKERWLP